MKWSWFKVPVKVKQINEYIFSDTAQSQKTKSGSDEISQGYFSVNIDLAKLQSHGISGRTLAWITSFFIESPSSSYS